ncbi:MAG: hypothetical protein V1718_01305 [archaeon]
MVNIENLFNNAFSAIRAQPKILLPLVLNWIPQTVITVAMSLIASDIIKGYTLNQLLASFKADPSGFILAMLSAYPYHLGFIALSIILSAFISSFIKSFYPTLSYQIYYHKKIELNKATELAGKRYLKVLWTDALFGLISNTIIFGLIFGAILLFIFLAAAGGGVGMIIGAITAIIAAGLLFVAVAYIIPITVILEPVVVIENLGGFAAIKKSHQILKGKLGHVWRFIIFLAIANGLYHAMVGLLVGIFEFTIGKYAAIFQMILLLLASAFILLSYGLLYLEISPVSINLSDHQEKTKTY